jgi:glycosyltransferase involved in cell wall biosynthesis
MRIAVVRDIYLNVWDAGNFAGLADLEGVELYLCGRGDDLPWQQIGSLYPRAKLFQYSNLYEVLELEPDVIDVPDVHYEFSQYLIDRHTCVFVATWDNLPGKNTFNQSAMEALYKAHAFTARSQGARKALEWDGVPRSKIRVIPGAVDTEFFSPGDCAREQAVAFVARLVSEKGGKQLVWAMKEVPDTKLWIVGEGSEKNLLKRWVDKAGIDDRTKFWGNRNRDELAAIYRHAMVLAVPSVPRLEEDPYATWSEQFGQVIIEGLASGLPIVGNRSGAIPEVGGHACGYYSDPLEWEKMAEHIDKLVNDPAKWAEMSGKARKRAELSYAKDVVARKLLTWYRNGL